jgi:SAM-dependent methyltransferase
VTAACRFCGSKDGTVIGAEVSDAPEAKVYRCDTCGFVYLFPIMTEDEETAFYRSEFERYMQARSGPGWKSPEAHFRDYQAEGERRLPLVRPYLKADDAVLEIGSSTGYFLDDLRGYVREAVGVEPSEAYRDYANSRGLETRATLADWDGRPFDVLALYYVLEHLRDPIGYLAAFQKILNPGGRVLIEVPNVDDVLLGPYRIPKFGPFYWQRAHYQYFSHRTLAQALERAGFQATMIPVQRYDLSNHMVWMMDGRPGGAGRFADLFTPALDAAYRDALKASWRCDTVFAVARTRA